MPQKHFCEVLISESPYEHRTIFGLPFFENYFIEFNNEGKGSITLGVSEHSNAKVIEIWPVWVIAVVAVIASIFVIIVLVMAWIDFKKKQFER